MTMPSLLILLLLAVSFTCGMSWPGYGHIQARFTPEEKAYREAYKHDLEWDDQLDGSYDLTESDPVITAADDSVEQDLPAATADPLEESVKTVVVPRALAPKKGPAAYVHKPTIHDEVPFYLRSDRNADVTSSSTPAATTDSWNYAAKDLSEGDSQEEEITLGANQEEEQAEIDPALATTIKEANLEQSADRPSEDDMNLDRDESDDDQISSQEASEEKNSATAAPLIAPPTVVTPRATTPETHAPFRSTRRRSLSTAPSLPTQTSPSLEMVSSGAVAPSHLLDSSAEMIVAQKKSITVKKVEEDNLTMPVVVGCISGVVVLSCIIAAVLYRRTVQRRKMSSRRQSDDEPYYGITGPGNYTRGSLNFSGDRLLAKSAEALHFQTQKTYLQTSRSNSTGSARSGQVVMTSGPGSSVVSRERSQELQSDYDSDEDEGADQASDFGEYTVYECPGLAPATDSFEVVNPLFAHQEASDAAVVVVPSDE